jgi:hypothetical protein
MTIAEFLHLPLLETPTERPDGVDYYYHVIKLNNQYLRVLKTVESFPLVGNQGMASIADIIEPVRNLNLAIIKALQKYYEGNPAKAYEEFKLGMQIAENRRLPINFHCPSPAERFYRIRVGKPGQSFSPKELFHVPMTERERISSQRFSIPGFPCLYLSSSTYLCWVEMGRPPLDYCHVSKFHPHPHFETMVLLDIRNILTALRLEAKKRRPVWDGKLLRFLHHWPLICATSVKVKYPGLYFKPEYIIPQLLLQYVHDVDNFKIHGIAYSSTRTSNPNMFNVAIPIRATGKEPYCNVLTKSFKFTSPISWEYLNLTGTGNAIWDDCEFEPQRAQGDIEIIDGVTDSYEHTAFGLMERILYNEGPRFPMLQIDVNGNVVTA